MAITPEVDKGALNVRHLPTHSNHPNMRNPHGQDFMRSSEAGERIYATEDLDGLEQRFARDLVARGSLVIKVILLVMLEQCNLYKISIKKIDESRASAQLK